jgi:lipoprotein-releasing system ATP-binding protein
MSVLEAQHLKKSFLDPKRHDVLIDISLTVENGESVAICGRSGEGKTTLLHILGTLEESDAGRLATNGTDVSMKNAPQLRQKHIGFIFQAFNLLEDFTALDNILMPARIARKRVDQKSAAYQNALENLKEIDLIDRAHMPARLLSGGERQRIAIARALSNDPSLILADEPSGNLDRANAQRIGEMLMRCVTAKKKSLVLVTHDMDLASLCHRRYLLKDGHLISA